MPFWSNPAFSAKARQANLATLLSQAPGATVVTRDAAAISAQGIDADVFCNSRGSVYPADISDKVYEFLAREEDRCCTWAAFLSAAP